MTAPEREFTELLGAWADAIVANDAEAIGTFADPDWILVGETGVVERSAFLDAVASGVLTHSWMAFDVHRVRIDGQVATVVARGRNRGTMRGEPFALDEWVSEVFVHRDGGWKCAVTHLTAVAQG